MALTSTLGSPGIEIREVDRWFPSSKTCSACGFIKKDLKLIDREWTCPNCKTHHDRDLNASINLRDCKEYKVINTDGLSGIDDCGLSRISVESAFGTIEDRQEEAVTSLKCTNSSKARLLSTN